MGVLIDIVGPDGDVINIYMTDAADPWSQSIHYSTLLHRRGIFYSHGHYHPFVKPPRCIDSCQANIIRVHTCLEKAICHVDLPKYLSSCNVSEDVIYMGDRKTICDCVAVKLPVIIYPSWQDSGICFWNDKRATTSQCRRKSDLASIQMLL